MSIRHKKLFSGYRCAHSGKAKVKYSVLNYCFYLASIYLRYSLLTQAVVSVWIQLICGNVWVVCTNKGAEPLGDRS